MKASEVLRQALELLGPNGEYWLQGDYKAGDKYCASGYEKAIAEAELEELCTPATHSSN